MKNRYSVVLIVPVLLILAVPHVFTPFFRDREADFAAYENRNITAFPTQCRWRNFFPLLEEYCNDRLPFRRQLLLAGHRIQRFFFPPRSSKVIFGRDGFLFLRIPGSRSCPFAQYSGKNAPRATVFQLRRIRSHVKRIRNHVEQCGSRVVFLIPPNKINIHAGKLPEKLAYARTAPTFVDALVANFKEHELPVLDLEEPLLRYCKQIRKPLYFAPDTHWNRLGAYCALKEILEFTGGKLPARWPAPKRAVLRRISTHEQGDLVAFLGPDSLELKKKINIDFTLRLPNYQVETSQVDVGGLSCTKTENPRSPDPRKVLVIGDSFTYAMKYPFGACFRTVYYYRGDEYRKVLTETLHPDLVIYEMVARNWPLMYRKDR